MVAYSALCGAIGSRRVIAMLLFGDLDCRNVIGSPLEEKALVRTPSKGCPLPPDRRHMPNTAHCGIVATTAMVDHSTCDATNRLPSACDEEELRG